MSRVLLCHRIADFGRSGFALRRMTLGGGGKQRPLSQDPRNKPNSQIFKSRSCERTGSSSRRGGPEGSSGLQQGLASLPRPHPASSLSHIKKLRRVAFDAFALLPLQLIFCAPRVFTSPYLQQAPSAVGDCASVCFALELAGVDEADGRIPDTTPLMLERSRLDAPFFFWIMCDCIAEAGIGSGVDLSCGF